MAKPLLQAADTIPLFKRKLAAKLPRRSGTEGCQLKKVMRSYCAAFALKDKHCDLQAVLLSLTFEAVARVAAEGVHDLNVLPVIAAKLARVYGSRLRPAHPGDRQERAAHRRSLELARVLVRDDPLTLYLGRQLSLRAAQQRLWHMADLSDRTVQDLTELLWQRFQARMSTYSWRRVRQEEDRHEPFSVRESRGELSQDYFRELFGENEPRWLKPGTLQIRLNFRRAVLARLRLLLRAPRDPPRRLRAIKFPEKRRLLFRGVAARDKSKCNQVDRRVIGRLRHFYRLSQSEGRFLYERMLAWLRYQPLTITCNFKSWFRAKVPNRTDGSCIVRSALARDRSRISFAELFGDRLVRGALDIHYAARPSFGRDRGADYWRYRLSKDEKLTAGLDFKPREMPVYGCLNTSCWPLLRGSNPDRFPFGKNDFGDCSFVLIKKRLSKFVLFGATPPGESHTDLRLILEDLLLPETNKVGTVGAVKRRKSAARQKRISLEALHQIAGNASAGEGMAYGGSLRVEARIFKEIDITRDVLSVHVSAAAARRGLNHLKIFSKKNGVPFELIGPVNPGIKIVSTRKDNPALRKRIKRQVQALLRPSRKSRRQAKFD